MTEPLSVGVPSLLDGLLPNLDMPVFFVRRADQVTGWRLSSVPAHARDALARELAADADGCAMLGGVAGVEAWALKIEAPDETCTVLLRRSEGQLFARVM